MNTKKHKEIKTRTARIGLDENGVIRFVVRLPNAEISLEDAEENIAVVANLCKGKKCPLFIDAELQKSMSWKARMYFTENSTKIFTAVAVVTCSPVQKIVASFIIGLNKRINQEKIPIKIFPNENNAIQWLKEYLE